MKKIILILLVATQVVFSTEYFVKSASEIHEKMGSLNPGDTLVLKNGVWSGQRIEFEAIGTEEAPIVIKAEEYGGVIFTGNSKFEFSGKYIIVDGLLFYKGSHSSDEGVIEFRTSTKTFAHYSRLTNCAVIDFNPPQKGLAYKWVSIYGTHNRVDHCYFDGKNHEGALLVVWLKNESNYHRIDHNFFTNIPEYAPGNGAETIRIGTSTNSMVNSRTTVEYNYFENCSGEIEIISNKSCENIYRGNTFVRCKGTLTLRHGNRCTVKDNFFFGENISETGGVRIIGEDHKVYNNYFQDLGGTSEEWRSAITMMNGVPNSPLNRYFQVKNALVAFNTIVNCKSIITIGAGVSSEASLAPTNSTFANNVVSSKESYTVAVFDQPTDFVWEGNYFYGIDWGYENEPGITWGDPKLEFAKDSLYRPAENSPVIGHAEGDYSFIEYDMDGQFRNIPKDAGADQVSSDEIVNKPIKASDYYPSWLENLDIPFILSVNYDGSGEVKLTPAGGLYEAGTEVEILAVPDDEWTFEKWKGDIESTENPLKVVINGDLQITAVFTPPTKYKISFWKIGQGEVEVTPSKNEYDVNELVEIKAIPANGWEFLGWSASHTGNKNPDTLIMDSNKGITVTFGEISGLTDGNIIKDFRLFQNYPNPFNPSTKIVYQIPKASQVKIDIYDANGALINNLVDDYQSQGTYSVQWNAAEQSSGVYFISMKAESYKSVRKMILIK